MMKLTSVELQNFYLLTKSYTRRRLIIPWCFVCHNCTGFHFSKHQMYPLLKPLIYHPDLEDMIMKIVNKCLICTIAAPKRVRTLVGAQRSNYYAPSQCLVVDSCYLPKSQYGFSKALILVNACTGYIIVYPSQNLLAATVRRHLLIYLSSHLIPSEIKADFGLEFQQELDVFLARYNIELTSSKPYSKGSTSHAESAVRLVKDALRQLCLSHTSNWPQLTLKVVMELVHRGVNYIFHLIPTPTP